MLRSLISADHGDFNFHELHEGKVHEEFKNFHFGIRVENGPELAPVFGKDVVYQLSFRQETLHRQALVGNEIVKFSRNFFREGAVNHELVFGVHKRHRFAIL